MHYFCSVEILGFDVSTKQTKLAKAIPSVPRQRAAPGRQQLQFNSIVSTKTRCYAPLSLLKCTAQLKIVDFRCPSTTLKLAACAKDKFTNPVHKPSLGVHSPMSIFVLENRSDRHSPAR